MSIGIIGGGPNGLTALIECLSLNIPVKLYEKEKNIGGTWNLESDQSQAHISTRFNTSTLVSSIDLDEPLSKYYKENFVTCSQYLRYLQVLVDKYKLKPHIVFQSTIVDIIRENGKFTLCDETGKKYEHDYVIVATGRFGKEIVSKELNDERLSFDKPPFYHTRHWDLRKPNQSLAEMMEKDELTMLLVGGSYSAGEGLQEILEYHYKEGNTKRIKIYWSMTRNPDKVNVWLMDRMPCKGRKKALAWDEDITKCIIYQDSNAVSKILKPFTIPLNVVTEDGLYRMGIDKIAVCDVTIVQRALKDGILELIHEKIEIMHSKESEIEQNEKVQFLLKKSGKMKSVDCVLLATGYDYAEPSVTVGGQKRKLVAEGGLFRDMIPTEPELDYKIGYICTTKSAYALFGMVQWEARWLLHQWFLDTSGFLKREVPIWKKNWVPKDPNSLLDDIRFPLAQMEILAADIPNCLPSPIRSLFSLWPSTRNLALAQLFGPWTAHHYNWAPAIKTAKENEHDANRRKEFLLKGTEDLYKKSNSFLSFNALCLCWSTVYMTGLSAIIGGTICSLRYVGKFR